LYLLLGCAAVTPPTKSANPGDTIHEEVKARHEELTARQQAVRKDLQQRPKPEFLAEPVLPAYDPLEDRIVSFAMVDESIQSVLFALAKTVGMNIILDPAVQNEERRLTLNFEKVSAARVLREILSSYDLYYEAKEGIIRIRPFQEKIFSLNFINADVTSEFAVGGDVLGAGKDKSAGGLAGNFKLSGHSASRNNTYDVLEENIRVLVSGTGKFTLNRITGTLFVRDTPSAIRAVGRLVEQFKAMLDRQILIEARIIEVSLADGFRYGINWSALRDEAANYTRATLTGWSAGQGLILQHQESEYAVNAVVNALDSYGHTKVVSNPTIRSKHSQPAIISVGTSFTYKKSVETTRTSVGTAQDISTQVEVSTVFDGLILGVIPFIEEDGRISLLINPIKSDVDRASLVPEDVGGKDSGLSISLPRVLIKEISTTISLQNNEVAILGGLIDTRKTADDKGVPLLSRIPGLNLLFNDVTRNEETRELVIILSVSKV
jgi:MSHA type pilus biogenesis protein MshL